MLNETTTVLLIAGMREGRCREQLVLALESVAGVTRVDVNLYRARASITHDPLLDPAELIRAVLMAGYGASLTGDERGSRGPGARQEQEKR